MSTSRSTLTAFLRTKHFCTTQKPLFSRQLHCTRRLFVVKPFLLADIGEGITECQLIQWFIQPGARVEQFDKLCEVQSDKASVEITSPFDGVIKKLYYEPDDMAITGKPLVDIDIQGDLDPADEAKLGGGEETSESLDNELKDSKKSSDPKKHFKGKDSNAQESPILKSENRSESQPPDQNSSRSNHKTLATPAVRHMTKDFDVDIADVQGSGKDGRVLKEDVQRYVSQRDQCTPHHGFSTQQLETDREVPLTAVQNAMFKAMTRSLNIPHFLYSCSADMTAITALRTRLNASASPESKITNLALIMKALSIAFLQHPILNASLDTSDFKRPVLSYRGSHDFGIAVDTPSGLLVPVVRNVQNLSIYEIAVQMRELSNAARENRLKPSDFKGATFTVSNIGSVGGGVVAPVISEPQVAIIGIGRSKIVPAFNQQGELVKREELIFSWSADHRVVDGAECARCAERVKDLLEDPSAMLIRLR